MSFEGIIRPMLDFSLAIVNQDWQITFPSRCAMLIMFDFLKQYLYTQNPDALVALKTRKIVNVSLEKIKAAQSEFKG